MLDFTLTLTSPIEGEEIYVITFGFLSLSNKRIWL